MRLTSKISLFLGVLILWVSAGSQGFVKTPAEETNYSQYSQYEQIGYFLSRLDSLSKELTVQIVGRSLGTEEYSAKDLYLCVLTEEGGRSSAKTQPEKAHTLLRRGQARQ